MSWIDRLLGGIERLRLPLWAAFGILFAAAYAVVLALRLHDGQTMGQAVRTMPPIFLIWIAYLLVMTRYLNHVAGERLARFRAAMDVDDEEYGQLAYRLTTMPAGPAFWNGVAWLAVACVAFAFAYPDIARLHYARWEIVCTVLTYFFGGGIVYHTIHQLREVSRLHARSARIDLYHLDPLHAFAGLTAQTALGWIFLLYLTSHIVPREILESGFGATWIVVMAVAVAAFVVPLTGMHGRMVDAKREAIAATNDRLKRLTTERNEQIDRGAFDRLDDYDKATAAVLAEHERLSKISTWPWNTGTLRGFVSALLLPTVVRLVQEAAQRLTGLGQ